MRWTLTKTNLLLLTFLAMINACGNKQGGGVEQAPEAVVMILAESAIQAYLRTADRDDEKDLKMMTAFISPIGKIPFGDQSSLAPNIQRYQQKLEEIFSLPAFAPGYPTWSGIHEQLLEAKAGIMPGVFWSNAAVARVWRDTGREDDIFMNEMNGERTIEWSNSFHLYQNALLSSKDALSQVQELTPEEAQRLANSGQVVLAASILDTKKKKGRVGLVFPTTQKYNSGNGPIIVTAGPTPGHYYYRGWKSVAEAVKFFSVPLKKTWAVPPANDLADKLMATITEVIHQDQFQPGYPSWKGINVYGLPKTPGVEDGVTWCNTAAYAIVSEMGVDASPMVEASGGIYWTDADQMARNLKYAAENEQSRVREVDEFSAQKLANAGQVVVVASEKNLTNGSGHMGVVAPNNRPFNPKVGPLIGQAGASNGFFTWRQWRVDWGKSPRFYLLQH